ncbi:MAG: hypothetical protein RLZ62_582 [Bacteroidota bacterium]|jgi:dipeptidyl-peptidase-4
MRYILFFLFPISLFSQKQITLEDIWQKGTFSAKGVPGFNFMNDGVRFTRQEGSAIVAYDLRTGKATDTIFDATNLKSTASGWKNTFDSYQFSGDESKMLLSVGSNQIYRWSSEADYYVLDLSSRQLTRIYEGSKQRDAAFSPDATKVAFVSGNDLYYKNLSTGELVRITTDGEKNAIINGSSDWVYEEEFELVRAYQWSSDGKNLAFIRFDEREVPEMTMEMYRNGVYPEQVTFKYPKVGENNAVVGAFIYHLDDRRMLPVAIPGRVSVDGRFDDYIPRIAWTPDGRLCLTWMNRHQNIQRLWLAEAQTGSCQLLLEEKNQYYIDLHDIDFLSDGAGFIMQSEKSGFNHLYRYDMSGKQVAAITRGDWEVTAYYGLDEKNGQVYFQAAMKDPSGREIYTTSTGGDKLKKISQEEGICSAQFSSTFDYYIHSFSAANRPPVYTVCDREGKVVRELEKNSALLEKMSEYGVLPVKFFQFNTSENVKLNGWMIRPEGSEYNGKQLPVLMFVYGGPGSQQVTDAWKGANYWWFQMLAQRGYVVACVDNRGTGARGETFKKMTYRQLGHYEVIDQTEAAKYLGTLPYVDPKRIGIFGWSYGGYMSSNCLLKGKDVFKAAIAVAPVTNWKWYDSVYTERYMQTYLENKDGYEQNSPVNFADQLQGNYLLVHGIADDNVHFQHSAEMVNKLIAANKQFDSMIYPNRNHGIGGGNARIHLFTMMTRFLDEKLKG